MAKALSIEDRLAIQDVFSRYCFLWDGNEGAEWAALFTPDGTCEVPGIKLEGTEQLKGMPAMGAQHGGGKFRHMITNVLAEPSGADEVQAKGYGLMTDWRDGGKFVMHALYRAKMRKVSGDWKIVALSAEAA
jgi:hypothetical protein